MTYEMNINQLNADRLSQSELIELVRMLVASGTSAEKVPITDPIALKYLKTLESDANELESTHAVVLSDDKNKMIMEADRVRDRALSVFRRLMQVYELSEDNSPEAHAYESLNELWLKKYDPLPYLSLPVETKGIEDLLFDLSMERYRKNIETLSLKDAVKKIGDTNEAFKAIYGEIGDEFESRSKPNYDVRALRKELIETVRLYVNYVKALSESSDNKEMRHLMHEIQTTAEHFNEQLASRHISAATQPEFAS